MIFRKYNYNTITIQGLSVKSTMWATCLQQINSRLFDVCGMQVVLGGGQEAMDVTTTSTRVGKFDARFFHTVFEEEMGRVKGHFGPINSTAFHPDGKR